MYSNAQLYRIKPPKGPEIVFAEESILTEVLTENQRVSRRASYVCIKNSGNVTAEIFTGFTLGPGEKQELCLTWGYVIQLEMNIKFDPNQVGIRRIDLLVQVSKGQGDYVDEYNV